MKGRELPDKMKNLDTFGKVGEILSTGVQTAKGTVAMFDQSVLLVQMLPFTLSHPVEAIKYAYSAGKDFWSKERFDLNMAKLHEK